MSISKQGLIKCSLITKKFVGKNATLSEKIKFMLKTKNKATTMAIYFTIVNDIELLKTKGNWEADIKDTNKMILGIQNMINKKFGPTFY